jgi:D-alanyl-D-alanine carboxypeptidase
MQDDIASMLAQVTGVAPEVVAQASAAPAVVAAIEPAPEPEQVEVAAADWAEVVTIEKPLGVVGAPAVDAAPQRRPAKLLMASAEPAKDAPKAAPVVVTRVSTSGGRHWGVNVGRYASRATAERTLMQIALAESTTLRDGLRKVMERKGGYDANYMGLTQEQADLACRRLQARAMQCFTIGP